MYIYAKFQCVVHLHGHAAIALFLCRDDDMISLASNLSVSNLSTIGFLEDDDEGPVR